MFFAFRNPTVFGRKEEACEDLDFPVLILVLRDIPGRMHLFLTFYAGPAHQVGGAICAPRAAFRRFDAVRVT